MTAIQTDENQYIDLIRAIHTEGQDVVGRNGTTRELFGRTLRFSLEDGKLPLLTTKRVAWKTCLRELLWFVSGSTDNKKLVSKGVKIWNGNAAPEFLEARGLDYQDGFLGPIYGHQWRNFNGQYPYLNNSGAQADAPPGTTGIDQLRNVIDALSDPSQRTSRRIVMSAWNPSQNESMALPPCHVLCQFNVSSGRLNCMVYQRSADVGLGLPFNIASYGMLTHLIASHVGLMPGSLLLCIGSAHVYDDHWEALLQQCQRMPYRFPKVTINRRDAIDDYLESDFAVKGYSHHPPLKMEMRP